MATDAEPTVPESLSQPQSEQGGGLLAAIRRFDPRSARDLTRAVLFALLLILFGSLVYRYATYTGVLLSYPYEWDEDEGLPVYFAQRLIAHQPIYVDFNKLPMLQAVNFQCYTLRT